jgi:PAS domain S-box-containing protein
MHDDPVAGLASLLAEDPVDLYENAPCGYLSMLADGLILKANGTFSHLTGYAPEELVGGRRFPELLTPGGRLFYETHMRPLIRMQGFVREVALDLRAADGRDVPILVNAVQRGTAGSPDAVTRLTVFDISDRRKYERELLSAKAAAERTAKARHDLVAMVSHDVRAPLGAILTAAAMLEKTGGASETQARYLRVIRSSVAHALTVVNGVLDVASLETGNAMLREKPFELRGLIDEVTAAARLSASSKPELRVAAVVDSGVPMTVVGDRPKLSQVLTNLLTNAVKFTERGQVSVLVHATEQPAPTTPTLEFVVSDTGIGIPADKLADIFNEFTQAGDDIAERYGGAGLGLAISKRLLALYSSELHVSSTVGQGTTFSFRLSLRTPA